MLKSNRPQPQIGFNWFETIFEILNNGMKFKLFIGRHLFQLMITMIIVIIRMNKRTIELLFNTYRERIVL